MSQKQPLILNTPAKKFFMSQLLGSSSQQVWLQGIVVDISADSNDVLLDDGTGVIQATGVTQIIKDLYLHKGMYVMVAGQLKMIGNPNEMHCPSIRVFKIADLSNNPHSEALWMAEVIDVQSHIKWEKDG
ncbi:recQ-mediated genome instability protein 2-like [Montipora capricornis]|uniref:recQ-mediated genome instability protein 2-like n=1 Tax=Montipora capricornis TaxID=246305 RepID=UPI0035F11793